MNKNTPGTTRSSEPTDQRLRKATIPGIFCNETKTNRKKDDYFMLAQIRNNKCLMIRLKVSQIKNHSLYDTVKPIKGSGDGLG